MYAEAAVCLCGTSPCVPQWTVTHCDNAPLHPHTEQTAITEIAFNILFSIVIVGSVISLQELAQYQFELLPPG